MSIRVIAAAVLLSSVGAAHALDLTPAQTEGPYYPRTKPAETDSDLTRIGSGAVAKGEVVVLNGKVVDQTGQPMAKARIEIWQTDSNGIYLHPSDPRTQQRDKAFQFYGETVSADDGSFKFRTILPAPYTGRPRHIHAKITPAGGATLTTQFYFTSDSELASDGIARRLGKALASVTLSPVRSVDTSDARLDAEVTVVLPKVKR